MGKLLAPRLRPNSIARLIRASLENLSAKGVPAMAKAIRGQYCCCIASCKEAHPTAGSRSALPGPHSCPVGPPSLIRVLRRWTATMSTVHIFRREVTGG